MISYHGTSKTSAEEIFRNGVDVNLGGGELGQGFYSGEYLWEAKSWAIQKHSSEIVIELDSEDDEVLKLDILSLGIIEARDLRNRIKTNGTQHSHKSGHDTIWAPIVGSEKCKGNQFKWESPVSETLLNDRRTKRTMR